MRNFNPLSNCKTTWRSAAVVCLNKEQLEEGTIWKAVPDWNCLPNGTQSCICATTQHTTLVVTAGRNHTKSVIDFTLPGPLTLGRQQLIYMSQHRDLPRDAAAVECSLTNTASLIVCYQVAVVRQHLALTAETQPGMLTCLCQNVNIILWTRNIELLLPLSYF